MLFNSYAYAIFLPIVFMIYWILPQKYRWILLLVSSYYFYMCWNPKYVVLILGTTVITYLSALQIKRKPKYKKVSLAVSIIICMGVLFIFKYYNFALESISNFVRLFTIQFSPATLKLLLPVGISFYTFQTMSYVIDVYRGDIEPEKHFGYYATFISFFPQLVAGPIERTSNLLPQIKSEKKFDYDQASYGMKLMVWGFFKKIVIADNFSVYVDRVFGDCTSYKGGALLIASFLFAIQIYCDFSGYSDIAIGTAKLLGVNLMKNFDTPYFSASIKEFWRRWHISLSSWFCDYLYIPLGGSRCGKLKHYRNILITFLVSGIWHGANWTYVVWGGIHGIAQIIENLFMQKIKRQNTEKRHWIHIILVFLFCCMAWVFFRAATISDAFYILRNSLTGIIHPIRYIVTGIIDIGLSKKTVFELIFYFIILAGYDYFSLKGDVIEWLGKRPVCLRYFVYFAMLTVLVCFRASGEATFVYFQF